MRAIRRNKGLQAKSYGLNPANIFGYEPAPPAWYINKDVYDNAKKAGMTKEEQAVWIKSHGDL